MPYPTTTLTTLLTRLAERYDGQPWWTADSARRAINEALRMWNLITGTWTTTLTVQTDPTTPYILLPSILLKSTRISFNGTALIASSIFGFDHAIPNWQAHTTTSGGIVPTQPAYWAPVGLSVIAIFPRDASGPRDLLVKGVTATPVLVNGSDPLQLGDEEINTLLGYALSALAFSKGAATQQRFLPLYIEFYKAAAKRNSVFAGSGLYRKIIGLDRTRRAQPMEKIALPAGPPPVETP